MSFRVASRTVKPLARSACRSLSRWQLNQIRCASQDAQSLDITDPDMNGGYINPPAQKRALRDPYGDWWDKQERRNFGEPVHKDNDILGVFSPEPYTHASAGKAGLHFGVYVLAFCALAGTVYQLYPDRVSAPREFAGDLEAELGGPKAMTMKAETSETSETA